MNIAAPDTVSVSGVIDADDEILEEESLGVEPLLLQLVSGFPGRQQQRGVHTISASSSPISRR